MLVIKKRTLPYNTSLYVGAALVSLLSIAVFLAVIHLLPLLNVDRFAVVNEPKASRAPQSQQSPATDKPSDSPHPNTNKSDDSNHTVTASYAGSGQSSGTSVSSPTTSTSGRGSTSSAQPSVRPASAPSQQSNQSALSLSLPQLSNVSVCGCGL